MIIHGTGGKQKQCQTIHWTQYGDGKCERNKCGDVCAVLCIISCYIFSIAAAEPKISPRTFNTGIDYVSGVDSIEKGDIGGESRMINTDNSGDEITGDESASENNDRHNDCSDATQLFADLASKDFYSSIPDTFDERERLERETPTKRQHLLLASFKVSSERSDSCDDTNSSSVETGGEDNNNDDKNDSSSIDSDCDSDFDETNNDDVLEPLSN